MNKRTLGIVCNPQNAKDPGWIRRRGLPEDLVDDSNRILALAVSESRRILQLKSGIDSFSQETKR
jgi:hypothetical protein